MEKVYIIYTSLTVLFENPFWIGIFERETASGYEVCKITFGKEPKDYEVYSFMLQNWHRLKFSKAIKSDSVHKKSFNPKRMQRIINKQLKNEGIGTKAQQALKQQYEQGKAEHKKELKKQNEANKDRIYELRQQKRREKHKGH